MTLPRGLAAILLLASSLLAQQKKQQSHLAQTLALQDELGMTCAQILAMSSSDYIAKYVSIDDSTVDGQLRGIGWFGHCYDERTARLAASLAKRGVGPKKAALANLTDLEQKLAAFTKTALADNDLPTVPVKSAYAALYEKQFRYEFYQSYEQKAAKPKVQAKSPNAAPTTAAKPAPPTPKATQASPDLPSKPAPKLMGVPSPPATAPKPPASSAAPPPPSGVGGNPTSPSAQSPTDSSSPKDLDPFTKAKNHFGELLGSLPPEKIHEVHSAFGKLFNGNPVSEDLKVDIYKYAVFLLESPKDKPFAPPPF